MKRLIFIVIGLCLGMFANNAQQLEDECNAGKSAACASLGFMYGDGKKIKQDFKKAIIFSKKACELKNAMACYNLAMLYQNGLGTKKDLSTTKEYFGKACDFGEQGGCFQYKVLYRKGIR